MDNKQALIQKLLKTASRLDRINAADYWSPEDRNAYWQARQDFESAVTDCRNAGIDEKPLLKGYLL